MVRVEEICLYNNFICFQSGKIIVPDGSTVTGQGKRSTYHQTQNIGICSTLANDKLALSNAIITTELACRNIFN